MKRDPILAAIEEYKHTWQRLETLGKEIGEFERAHPGVTDCPRLVAMYGRETLLHEQVMEAATAFCNDNADYTGRRHSRGAARVRAVRGGRRFAERPCVIFHARKSFSARCDRQWMSGSSARTRCLKARGRASNDFDMAKWALF